MWPCGTMCTQACTAAGEPVYAWCGPQPNQRLLLNYGIVDESNPHDRLQLTATIPSSDRL